VSRIHELGWRHSIGLREGIEATYEWFKAHIASARLSSVPVGARPSAYARD
jgi:hypothetical protein